MTDASLGLVVDCAGPDKLARFWAPALGYTNLCAAGNNVLLIPADPGRPKLLLQAVPEAKVAKNRVHFDIETHDIDSEAARIESLAARRLETEARREHGTRWFVMADPGGNEFRVCDAGGG
jgi:predicted enzyme related to lactoylglutathione lyase